MISKYEPSSIINAYKQYSGEALNMLIKTGLFRKYGGDYDFLQALALPKDSFYHIIGSPKSLLAEPPVQGMELLPRDVQHTLNSISEYVNLSGRVVHTLQYTNGVSLPDTSGFDINTLLYNLTPHSFHIIPNKTTSLRRLEKPRTTKGVAVKVEERFALDRNVVTRLVLESHEGNFEFILHEAEPHANPVQLFRLFPILGTTVTPDEFGQATWNVYYHEA